MAKVAPEIKARLEADGTWRDFNRVRENEQKLGRTPVEAMRAAIERFCPDLSGVPMPSHKKAAPKAKAVQAASSPVRQPGGPPVADPSVFAGKTCSMAKAMDWIIDALAVDPSQVRPETAPAAKAWSLYLLCLKSPAFAEEVITKAVVRQIPNGKQDEDTGDSSFDGEKEYDILGAIGAGGGS